MSGPSPGVRGWARAYSPANLDYLQHLVTARPLGPECRNVPWQPGSRARLAPASIRHLRAKAMRSSSQSFSVATGYEAPDG